MKMLWLWGGGGHLIWWVWGKAGNLKRLCVVGVQATPLLSHLGFHIIVKIHQLAITIGDNWPPDWRRQEQRKASCEVELSPRASLSLLPPEDPHPASCHNNNNNNNNDNNENDNNNKNNYNEINSKIKSEDGDLGEAFESNASRRQGCVGLVFFSFALLNQPLIVMMIRMMITTMMMVNIYVLCLR